MQGIKNLTGIIIIAIIFTQCKTAAKDSFTVNINYKNANSLAQQPAKLLLEEIPYGGENRPVLLDSATVTANNGRIELKGRAKEEGVYGLIVDRGPVIVLINDQKEITVDIDFNKKNNYYDVSGSPASSKLKKFIENYGAKSIPVNTAFMELDSLKTMMADDSLLLATTNKKNNAIEALNAYIADFIATSKNASVSLFALGLASRSLPVSDFERMLNETVKKFPEHKELANLKRAYDNQQAKLREEQKVKEQQQGQWVGKAAPDLSMSTPPGETISISSFKGKFVLVDFWASWCGPCRMENPNLVKAYAKYKDKNFTILGVSLDRSKEPWIKAIQDDKLDWPQMSDLQFWNSKSVEVYQFQGIPYNVLIDPKGIIIAEGLRGDALEKKLAEVLR